MPRPGPRPYECVRRAWHSDRHKPIRGSLIQEIFRVVNEIHCSATKKNKEWQEKLPVVVLKAEEIMYSKANSEAEYMDLKTLWDRANDAINTIIRRDESTETGELLQPCIEAALNLGCTPRRASRSQRNNNVRCYLSSNTQEPTYNPPSILGKTIEGNHTTNLQYMSHYSNLVKPRTANSIHLGLDPNSPVAQNNNFSATKFPFSSEIFFPSSNNQCLPMETYPTSRLYSVYPLYYGNHLQCDESQLGFGIPPKSNSDTMEPAAMGIMPNPFSCNVDGSKKITQTDFSDIPENAPEIECDLSLRLGPLLVSCRSVENSWHQEVEDVGSSSSREGSKLCDPLPQMDKEFSFLPKSNANDPLDSCSSKWISKGENSNVQAVMRKRKALVGHPTEDRQFCCHPKLPCNDFNGRIRNAGL